MLPYRPRKKAPTTLTQSISRFWGAVTIEREHHPKWDTKKYCAGVGELRPRVIRMLRHVPPEIRFRSQLLNEENFLDRPYVSINSFADPTREVAALFEDVRCGKRPFGSFEWRLGSSEFFKVEALAKTITNSSLESAEFEYTDLAPSYENPTQWKYAEFRSLEFCVSGTIGENFDIDQLIRAYGVRSLLPHEIEIKILLQIQKAEKTPVARYLGKLTRQGSRTPVWLQGLLYGEPVENTISRRWKAYQEGFKARPRY